MPGSCHFGSLTKGQNYSASPDLPDVWKYLSAQINQQAIAVFLDLVLLGRYSIGAKAPQAVTRLFFITPEFLAFSDNILSHFQMS